MDLHTLSSFFLARSKVPSEGFRLSYRPWALIWIVLVPRWSGWIRYSWVGFFVLFRVGLCISRRAGPASTGPGLQLIPSLF